MSIACASTPLYRDTRTSIVGKGKKVKHACFASLISFEINFFTNSDYEYTYEYPPPPPHLIIDAAVSLIVNSKY